MRLGRIGFDNIAGYLGGGMAALAARPDLVERDERLTAVELAADLASVDPPLVLDVRSPAELEEGWIEGSLHIPLNHLHERLEAVPRDRRVVVTCGTGYRSTMGASILARSGFDDVADLIGGMSAWAASGLTRAR